MCAHLGIMELLGDVGHAASLTVVVSGSNITSVSVSVSEVDGMM